MPLVKRKRVLACKAETTEGTAEELAAADAAFIVHNALIQQQAEVEERQSQGGFGMHPSVVSARSGRATFSSHFYGGSATPAGWSTWLPACGLGGVVPVADITHYARDDVPAGGATSTQKTLTIGSYQDDTRKLLHGAMGTARFTLPAGRLATAEWDFLGVWNAPTDVAILAPTYPSLTPLRVVSASLTLGAYGDLKIAQALIDLGNEIALREDADSATGYAYATIAQQLVRVTLDPESELIATKDLFGEWLASTEANLSISLTNGTDTCTIAGSDLQIVNPQEQERNGLEVTQIECQLNADDLTITFA